MPHRRPLLLLALLAALLWAPSSVSGSQPDQLTSGTTLPVVGETVTSFVVSVRYTSTAGNPAQAVTAVVAGQTIPLVLVAGDTLDGTWAATTTLPEGSWVVTFNATTLAGPQPSPANSSVTVSSASSPPPAQSNDPSGSDEPGGGSGGAGEPAPQATASPRPSQAAPQRRSARASGSPAAAARPDRDRDNHERPRPRRPKSGDPSASPETEIAGGRGTPPPEPIKQPDSDGLWWVLVWGSGAVGAVALIGTGWLLLSGRRERRAAESGNGPETDLAVRAIPTVEQRALRRARLRPSDDPILAGLGLDEDEPRPKPRNATRAASPKPRRDARRER